MAAALSFANSFIAETYRIVKRPIANKVNDSVNKAMSGITG